MKPGSGKYKQKKSACVVINLKAYAEAGGKIYDPSKSIAKASGVDASTAALHSGTFLLEGFTEIVNGRKEAGVIPARFWTKAFMRDSNRTITPSARSRAPDTWASDPQ